MRELLDQGVVGNIYRTSKISGLIRTQVYHDRLDWRGTRAAKPCSTRESTVSICCNGSGGPKWRRP